MKVPKARKLSSGNWFIQLRLGGESIPVTARTEKECIRQAQYVKAEYQAGKRAAPPPEAEKPKGPTLGQAIDNYIAQRDAVLSPSTIRGYKTIRKNRFQSVMGMCLDDISSDNWQRIVNQEAKLPNCSAKTLKNAWGFVSSVIMDATGRPAPRVKLPQVIPNERPFLEPEQIRPFIDAVHGTKVEIPALLALSSLRRSEIVGLCWENIDLNKRLIRVKGSAVFDEHNKLTQKKENKNRSSTRTVPIMIAELYQALKREKKDSGPVVVCNPNTIWARINSICRQNQLPEIGVHGLRHSFVSLAYHLGIPEKIVMEIGGWSDYQTMRKIYTHTAKTDISKSTDMLKAFFSGQEENANKNANRL